MGFTPEPDPLELVGDSDGRVVGSAGSLGWSALCQVQYLMQVPLESEWGREPECAWRKPDQPRGHEYDGHTSRKIQDCIEHPLQRSCSCYPTFPTFQHSRARSLGPPRSVGGGIRDVSDSGSMSNLHVRRVV